MSEMSVAPTVMALGVRAGETPQASAASFPAATTKVTPAPMDPPLVSGGGGLN
jgi:hypothetical protein